MPQTPNVQVAAKLLAEIVARINQRSPRMFFFAIAEDALHKIEIAHQTARREEADLHALVRSKAGDAWTDGGPKKQGNETFRRLRLPRGEGQAQQLGWRAKGSLPHFDEGLFRHA